MKIFTPEQRIVTGHGLYSVSILIMCALVVVRLFDPHAVCDFEGGKWACTLPLGFIAAFGATLAAEGKWSLQNQRDAESLPLIDKESVVRSALPIVSSPESNTTDPQDRPFKM